MAEPLRNPMPNRPQPHVPQQTRAPERAPEPAPAVSPDVAPIGHPDAPTELPVSQVQTAATGGLLPRTRAEMEAGATAIAHRQPRQAS